VDDLRTSPALCGIRDLINSSDGGALTNHVVVNFLDPLPLGDKIELMRTEQGSCTFVVALSKVSTTLKYTGGGADRITMLEGSMLKIEGKGAHPIYEPDATTGLFAVFRELNLAATKKVKPSRETPSRKTK
jgi:hypothetical protein